METTRAPYQIKMYPFFRSLVDLKTLTYPFFRAFHEQKTAPIAFWNQSSNFGLKFSPMVLLLAKILSFYKKFSSEKRPKASMQSKIFNWWCFLGFNPSAPSNSPFGHFSASWLSKAAQNPVSSLFIVRGCLKISQLSEIALSKILQVFWN